MKTSLEHSRVAVSRPGAANTNAGAPNPAVCRHAATSRSGFTMVEIALCLAIIGFALVAIIGVLPAGLNVQKENREETIINQDATVWLDAIRSGALGYDDLTNHVDRIVVSNIVHDAGGLVVGVATILAQHPGTPIPPDYATARLVHLNSGGKIVGLLTTPKYQPVISGGGGYTNNVVIAYCRAISGSAVEKTPQQTDPEVREQAFAYRMLVEVARSENVLVAGGATNLSPLVLSGNLSDVRLLMRWPLRRPFSPGLPDPPVADTSRMTIRSEVSGLIAQGGTPDVQNNANIIPLYFIQPRIYR
jgi:type II secretory pathway pseudopilin PulG